MKPSISSSSVELLSGEYDPDEDIIDLEELKRRVQQDIQETKQGIDVTVDETKAAIANLVPFFKKTEPSDAGYSKDLDVSISIDKVRAQTQRFVGENLTQFQDKLKTDLQVVQLFDQISACEVKELVKRNIVDQSMNTVRDLTEKEFKKIQDDTNVSVTEAKLRVTNYLSNLTNDTFSKQKKIYAPNENEVIDKIKERTQEDFEKLNRKNQEDVDKAKCKVKENINKLLKYTTGTKTDKELKAEKTMMTKVNEFEKMMKENLEKEKSVTEQTINETKQKIATKIKNSEVDEETLKDLEEKLLKLRDKTRNDFREINSKLHDEVVSLKKKADLLNMPESDEGEKSIKNMIGKLKNNVQADFKETNAKINEDVKDLSQKVAQNVLTQIPQSSLNTEVNQIVDISLNQFQNTFEQTDKRMKDNVQGAKSKIDDSVNALKDKLFKK